MSDEKKTTATPEQEESGGQKRAGVLTVSLPIAIGMMKVVWEKEKRNPAPATTIMSHWSYAAKSSGGFQALASLKRYGLLEEVAGSTPRSLKVSPMALDLLKYENTDLAAYRKQLKFMALLPDINEQIWDKYGHELPSDKTLESHLVFDKHLSEESARQFIRIYKETITFAKLSEGDSVEETAGGKQEMETISTPVNTLPKATKPMISAVNVNELPVPIADGMVARIPYPMAEDDFDLLIETLKLWKNKLLIKKKVQNPDDRSTTESLTGV